jgi:hypothetical protein
MPRAAKGATKEEQAERFHAPLQPGDTEAKTVGCRHTNPDICGKNGMDVCAFVRADGVCHAPPRSWSAQFLRLRGAGSAAR